MPKFVNSKNGVEPQAEFYNKNVPPLDMEGNLCLKWATYSGDPKPKYQEDCVIIDNSTKYAGIYTAGMSACHALTMVQRDADGNIAKIAMQHFAGGLDKDKLDGFIKHCIGQGFNGNLELVHYPGNSATGESDNKFERVLQNRTFENEKEIQTIYHADPTESCCVMFNGQIGHASFAPDLIGKVQKPNMECELNLSELIQSKAVDNFNRLIFRYREEDPSKTQYLETLMDTILKDKASDNPHKLLEKTRQLIIKAELSPEDKKQELYTKYANDVNKQPCLSTATKIACVALAATIIGIIPAIIIASRYKSTVKDLRESQLKTVEDCLNVSSPCMR
ncbi:hypothetical protein Lsan_2189 [Legionella santicrucis]|uniref:Uncharacterized protein n=1 Tax=Legionella santicrucis TaxID=45074 RepID=A0A0W0YSI2_9GAMM|nr:hypothetical protein [Legionella santicrucis]KTD59598.1 hypothetical protein Lsan_2189 [Legionella santicrucis]